MITKSYLSSIQLLTDSLLTVRSNAYLHFTYYSFKCLLTCDLPFVQTLTYMLLTASSNTYLYITYYYYLLLVSMLAYIQLTIHITNYLLVKSDLY